MDVSNLIPSQGVPKPAATVSQRPKADVAPEAATTAAAAPAGGSSTPRPTSPPTPTGSVSDRVERSPELQQRLAELRHELGRQDQVAREHVAEVSRHVREALDASHEALLKAAAGILHGELYFVAS